MGRKLAFGEVLLDANADDEGQLRGRVTAYATVRTADSLRVGVVEISYAEVRAMINILTEERTHCRQGNNARLAKGSRERYCVQPTADRRLPI
jgi:hypothetical protein